MMVNALAKRRMLDSSLLGDISLAAQRLDPLTYSPQSVAIILNSYSKLPRPDSSLFIYMSTVATIYLHIHVYICMYMYLPASTSLTKPYKYIPN